MNCLSSDRGRSLDTDFIVGTAIEFFKIEKKCDVVWEHISDVPSQEKDRISELKPVLQDPEIGDILPALKQKRRIGYWRRTEKRVDEATRTMHCWLKKKPDECQFPPPAFPLADLRKN